MPIAYSTLGPRVGSFTAACLAILAATLLSACGQEQRSGTLNDSTNALSDTVGEVKASKSQGIPAKTPRYLNATIVSDTGINEPQAESHDSTSILRLPPNMARILEDSLPGLKPRELVIGDFNGDSRRDVAIDADAPNTAAFLILLSKSDSIPKPRLFLVWKIESRVAGLYTEMSLVHPQGFPGNSETEPYTLRTDAVLYGYENAASIYFIEKGELRRYSLAD